MATIGLDKLYYAKITEGDNGDETYGTPTQLAKAMTAELSVELAEATLYAYDGAAEVVKEFQSGTLTLGIHYDLESYADIVDTPMGVNVDTRIISIEYDPFYRYTVRVEVGDYVPNLLASTATQLDRVRQEFKAADGKLLSSIKSANIAVTVATSPTASERSVIPVTDDYRARLERYLASMLQAKRMLSMGILTPEDYAIIDTMQGEKFGISSCSLYRGIDLIYSGFRGNMSHYEEVTKCQEQ